MGEAVNCLTCKRDTYRRVPVCSFCVTEFKRLEVENKRLKDGLRSISESSIKMRRVVESGAIGTRSVVGDAVLNIEDVLRDLQDDK